MTDRTYHRILEYFRKISAGTKWEGHLYAVGGCVRDEILGAPVHDVDIAVDIPNGGVDFARWLLRRRQTVGVPIFFRKFGTAKLRLRRFPEEEIETVQTRAEKYTSSTSRCPEVVSGSITDDCFRRDFTVNTLYRNITTGEILDLTGRGVHDIREGLIKTPMDPYETFDDDPVRILRCLRFAARFGWRIDGDTMDALRESVGRLSIVSRERWSGEFRKMLFGKNVRQSLGLLAEIGGLRYMNQMMRAMSEKRPWPDSPTLLETAIDDIARLEEEGVDDEVSRLVAFFGNIGMIKTGVRDRSGRMRYPRHEHTGGLMAARLLRQMGVGRDICDAVCMRIQERGLVRMQEEKQRRIEEHKAMQRHQHEEKQRRRRENAARRGKRKTGDIKASDGVMPEQAGTGQPVVSDTESVVSGNK